MLATPILLLLMIIVPFVFILLFMFIFVRLASEPIIIIGEGDEWRGERSGRTFKEPFRWVAPGGGYSQGAVNSRLLDEVGVYKELVNHVSRMCYEGRISPVTRDRVMGELIRIVNRLEGGQGEDSSTSS